MGDFNRSKPSRFGGRDSRRPNRRDSYERDSSRSFDRRDFGGRDREMHSVICAKCGKQCEVPFKPTTNKPVFCSDCFRKNDSRDSDRPSSSGLSNSKELEQINAKLDKILSILEEIEDEEIEED